VIVSEPLLSQDLAVSAQAELRNGVDSAGDCDQGLDRVVGLQDSVKWGRRSDPTRFMGWFQDSLEHIRQNVDRLSVDLGVVDGKFTGFVNEVNQADSRNSVVFENAGQARKEM
jgi:hypothetical protein